MRTPTILLSFVLAAIASPDTFLFKRQNLGSIPSQCDSQCTSVSNTINGCNGVASCFCTNTVYQDLATCAQCVSNLAKDADDMQTALNDFQQGCQELGTTLATITITGSSGGGGGGGGATSTSSPNVPTGTTNVSAPPPTSVTSEPSIPNTISPAGSSGNSSPTVTGVTAPPSSIPANSNGALNLQSTSSLFIITFALLGLGLF